MRRFVTGLLCVLALALLAGPAWADAVIERFTRSDGFAGMGAFEQTSLTVTSPTAQREEGTMKFTGSFLGAIQRMAGVGGDTARITRLDRDLVWELDPEKKTFTEQPLTARGERERAQPTQPGQRPKDKAEPSDVVITKNEFKVEKTGARKTINAFPCEEYLATWLLETRNTKTGEIGKSVMTDRTWTTPETAEIRAAQAVELAYARTYLKKLGLEMKPEEAKKFLAGLTGLSEQDQQKALARVSAEMAKIQGFHIVTQIEWNIEGSGGTTAGSSGGGSGGRDPSAAEVIGQLGKLFGGGGKGSGSDPSAGGRAGQEKSPALFHLYTEVKSIRTAPSDPSRFEVPAGYTRK